MVINFQTGLLLLQRKVNRIKMGLTPGDSYDKYSGTLNVIIPSVALIIITTDAPLVMPVINREFSPPLESGDSEIWIPDE